MSLYVVFKWNDSSYRHHEIQLIFNFLPFYFKWDRQKQNMTVLLQQPLVLRGPGLHIVQSILQTIHSDGEL